MIITKSSFGRGFNPLSNPKHKTCWLRHANKKRNKRRYIICTRVKRDLLTSVLTSTCFLRRIHPVVEIFCDPKLWIFVRGVRYKCVPCVDFGYTNPYAVPAGYVHLIPYLSVLILLCIACTADVVFGTASFPQRRRKFTVQKSNYLPGIVQDKSVIISSTCSAYPSLT
jgi:hypothetical protein